MKIVSRISTIFFICSNYLLLSSFAANTLSKNQSISDGKTLISPGEKFELGFFSPGRSKNRYLGIWYKTTPDIVVWVANRNAPVTDLQGVLTLSHNGALILLNSTKIVVWSSNSSKAASPIVQLLDTGNLVLIDEKGSKRVYLWQSFDYPGNTRLPGMLMGENLETGTEQYLTSWRNSDDPSSGEFTYRLETNGLPENVLKTGNKRRFRTGPWNGIRMNGLPMFPNLAFDSIVLGFHEGRLVSLVDPYNDSFITRLTLNESGVIQRYKFDDKKNIWSLLYTIPNNPCDNYEQCGVNSVCNTNTSPMCRCLTGFSPKFKREWDLLDWSGGCERITPLNCDNRDGFFQVPGLKLPDILQIQLTMNMSLEKCKIECLRNCSCVAYTDPYVNEGSQGCLMWFGDLVDIREFAVEKSEQNIYLRLPLSEIGSVGISSEKKKKSTTILLIIIASVVLIICMAFGFFVKRHVMRRERPKKEKNEEDLELPLYDFATVSAATSHFCHSNRIGEGGFGPVYKGKLEGDQDIAVKRLSESSGQGCEEFKTEVVLIAKLQHRNLVQLLGCCIQGEERILIYEYLQNKSLDNFIFDTNRRALLTWTKRYDIIVGISRGLLYLHQDSRLKIIHRDLKTSNILLDNNLDPKISDFGLARIFGGDQASEKTKRVVGTYGYIAPEYAIDGEFSVKSDVFSLGVIFLEIVSGKRNRNFYHSDHHHSLLGHAWLLWNDNRAMDLMDSTCLEHQYVESQVKRCIQVGLLCVQKLAEDRPTMSSVLFMLGNEEAILPQPTEPGFFIERSCSNYHADESIVGSEVSIVDNMLNITQLQAR